MVARQVANQYTTSIVAVIKNLKQIKQKAAVHEGVSCRKSPLDSPPTLCDATPGFNKKGLPRPVKLNIQIYSVTQVNFEY